MKHLAVCEICGTEYLCYPSWAKSRRTCSRKCGGVLKSREKSGDNSPRKGVPHTEETKKKISQKNKGINKWYGEENPMFGKKPWNSGLKTGIVPSTAFKKGQSAWNLGLKGFQAGESNVNWKGGVTLLNDQERKTLELKIWKFYLRSIFGYTCFKCGTKGGYLNVHHIYNFHNNESLRDSIDNGVVLCKTCHREFHSKNGNKNNSALQLFNFIYEQPCLQDIQ